MRERYQIKGKIGQGGVGAVYRAFDASLKRDVAIKRLLPDDNTPEGERRTAELLVREAGMLSKLQHPNIVTVYDVGIDDDGGYVVMELIEGETFDVTIGRGALTATDFAQVVDQTLEAMIAAQEIGMLHRDIKPSNVMVTWLPSGRFQVKVLDFGLAKLSQTPTLQTVDHGDSIMGSIYFMAPEQFDREPLDARTDLYSLGCLYYYGLSGMYPFDSDTAAGVMIAHIEHEVLPLAELRPDLPPEVCGWVMRLISKEMGRRPASAREAQKGFEPALAAIRAAANPKPAGVAAVARPTTKPSPNRPHLITGPVDPMRRYTAPPHTTTHHHHSRKPGPSATAVFLWSIVALALVAAFWLFLRERGAGGVPAPGDKPGADAAPESGEPEAAPALAAAPSGAQRQLPYREDIGSGHPPQRFIHENSRWRYSVEDVDAATWFLPGFKDHHWPEGKSPLGFGDPVETELRGEDSEEPQRLTFYFRKSIRIKDAAAADDPGAFVAQVQYDDGFRMYLNGEEVLREGLPDGPIGPGTLAMKTRRGDGSEEMEYVRFQLPPDSLREGQNVFAVEVHQANLNSSDVRFSMILDFVEKKS